MVLKQLSIFVENRLGTIAEATGVLADNSINIRALTSADTAEFGRIRSIVDNPDAAAEKLRENSLIVNITNVIAIRLPDKPGSFHSILKLLYEAGIAVEYSYAFVSRNEGIAYVILRVQDEEAAVAVLSSNQVEFIDKAD